MPLARQAAVGFFHAAGKAQKGSVVRKFAHRIFMVHGMDIMDIMEGGIARPGKGA